ncbi:hypothetical protein QTH09_00220 [Clostridium perfringens]|nr:hypothetical protein [Clostridium perfringens]
MNNIPDCRYEYGDEEKEPKVAFECTECGYDICFGDEFYSIEDKKICCDCIEAFKDIAGECF